MENQRKLYRSRKDVVVSGVCSGIAKSVGIDPTIIRLLWAGTILFYGTGIFAYILCAIIIPKEPIMPRPTHCHESCDRNRDSTSENDYNI